MADKLNNLIFSEFLVDNTASGGVDLDGDGSGSKSEEYVELQNTSGSAISLDGYEIWSDDRGQLYSFGPGDTIAAGQTATVIGAYTGTLPAGYFDAGLNENDDFLEDGEGSKNDTIYLVDTATGDNIAFSYGSPPPPPSPPGGFPGTNQIGAGEALNSTGPNGVAFARDSNGDFVEASPDPGAPGVACYSVGTMIETPDGPRRIESLSVGGLVSTVDKGPAAVRWLVFQQEDFAQSDRHRPVEIKAGALGSNRPHRDLVVSANHRILVGGLGQLSDAFPHQVFVPAKALVGLPKVRVMSGKRSMQWVHLVLEEHSIIVANGAFSESMLPGPVARATFPASLRRHDWSKVTCLRGRQLKTALPSLSVRETARILATDSGGQARARRTG